MKTGTLEKGMEALIADMTGRTAAPPGGGFSEEPEPFVDLHNWLLGHSKAYGRASIVDLVQLRAFHAPSLWRGTRCSSSKDEDETGIDEAGNQPCSCLCRKK